MSDNPTQAHKLPGKGTDPQVHKGEHSPSLAEPSVNMHIEYAVEWRNRKTGKWKNLFGWSKELPDDDLLTGKPWERVVYRYVTEPQEL